ncbi:GTPase IMAP family member 9-like [Garra rufa]|uniref:GTPase IMAP family member 9-like n=1 Tax=Garra rufa TaxID=137080 RepID=UPI003CCE83B3
MLTITSNGKECAKELHIVSIGKTGDGKSHTGNAILCNPAAFHTKRSSVSVTQTCRTGTATVNGRTIKYIDTPGFFDTRTLRSEQELNLEIVRLMIKCAQGPHVFLILLKVETYTRQEDETVRKIAKTFGEDALKRAVVLFTHGDDLDEGQTIEEFVSENSELQKLVDKCGGRCHVIDNKYWNQQEDEYRNNKVQIQKLMKTIDEMLKENGGGCYNNKLLQEAKKLQEIIAASDGRWSEKLIREKAEKKVQSKFTGVAIKVLLGALLGVPECVEIVLQRLWVNEDNFVTAETVQEDGSGKKGQMVNAVRSGNMWHNKQSCSDIPIRI